MKTAISLMLACLLSLGLLGCGSAAGTGSRTEAPAHKTLIVYFSYTGNTQALAHKIHDRIGGDIVELQLKTPYSSDYKHVEQQGKDEVEQGFKPELATVIDNFDQYDTVVIGSPVWWYHMTPAVASFMSQYDFSGKTVVPFITHGGWEGTALQDIGHEARGASVKEGLSVKGQDVSGADGQIDQWLRRVGLMQ